VCLAALDCLCVFVLQEDLQHWRTKIATNTREWEVSSTGHSPPMARRLSQMLLAEPEAADLHVQNSTRSQHISTNVASSSVALLMLDLCAHTTRFCSACQYSVTLLVSCCRSAMLHCGVRRS
jgi:hypothetical protein